jgi:hypothetical protein
VWPIIDAINSVMWPVLLGLSYPYYDIINKWMNLIAPGALGVGALVSTFATDASNGFIGDGGSINCNNKDTSMASSTSE